MLISKPTLSDWLSYLETLHPKTIDLGLARIQEVTDRLSLSKPAPYVITVAGTNGKGTTVTVISAIYQAAGFKVGTYTSPHLWRFNERIAINGLPVSDAILVQAFEMIEKVRGDISLTYFEFTTLAAFYIFKQAHLDVAVLEIGMGGRLDAVNMVDPDIAVITSIDLDHQEYLGNTREKIGAEKAGILRKSIPLVAGRNLTRNIYEKAEEYRCAVYTLGDHFEVIDKDPGFFTFKSAKNIFSKIPKNHLLVDNIALSLTVAELLAANLPVSVDHIRIALIDVVAQCRLPGRQQVIARPVMQVFDVAHNPQGVVELSAALKGDNSFNKTFAVFSMLRDKDIASCVKIMAPLIDEWYVSGLSDPRGMTSAEIGAQVSSLVTETVKVCGTIEEAYEKALAGAKAGEGVRLVVFGSFHVVSKLLEPSS